MKMLAFIHNPSNYAKVMQLSRREEQHCRSYAVLRLDSQFNQETGDYESFNHQTYAKKAALNQKRTQSRNVALNARNQTAELRLFRGTLRDDRLWASLQFYDLLIQFTSMGQPGTDKWVDFRNYVHDTGKQYSALRSYFQEAQL